MTQPNWRLFWSVLVLASSLTLWGAPGRAGDLTPVCSPGDPTRCAQPLSLGQPAPFSGQLLSPTLALDLGQKASFCDERLDLELKHVKAEASIDLTLEKQLRGNDKITWDAEKALLLDRLAEAKKPPPWYTHPAFIITMSVLATIGLSYGMFELATRIK